MDSVVGVLAAAAERHGRTAWRTDHVVDGLKNDATLLGEINGLVVATATLQTTDPDVWGTDVAIRAETLYVHRLATSRSGAGIGAAMLSAAEDWAASSGARLVRLDCAAQNLRLRRYYADHGYSEVAEVERPSWRLALFEKYVRPTLAT
jgi:GNAT superfamily N-acetyltransferase